MVLRVAFVDGPSHGGARVNSCMAHVIARHRVEKNRRLTQFCLFVCGVLSLRVYLAHLESLRQFAEYWCIIRSCPKRWAIVHRDARGESVHLLLFRHAVSLVARDQV